MNFLVVPNWHVSKEANKIFNSFSQFYLDFFHFNFRLRGSFVKKLLISVQNDDAVRLNSRKGFLSNAKKHL